MGEDHKYFVSWPKPSQNRLFVSKFTHLYIYDIENEVSNGIKVVKHYGDNTNLELDIIERFIKMFNKEIHLAKIYRQGIDLKNLNCELYEED